MSSTSLREGISIAKRLDQHIASGMTVSVVLSQLGRQPSHELLNTPALDESLIQSEVLWPPQISPQSETRGRSKSIQSATSTVRHDEIPFEQLKPQILELCQHLWPPNENSYGSLELPSKETNVPFLRRFSRSASHVIKGSRPKSPIPSLHPETPGRFIIERMRGGSYNRVVGIIIKSPSDDIAAELVLRIPRSDRHTPRPDRDVAISRYVQQHTSVPVADVMKFDFSDSNPLKAPYVVQNRIPGRDLDTAFSELNVEQLVHLARRIGLITYDLLSARSPIPGILDATDNDQGPTLTIRPFSIKSPLDMEWDEMTAIEKSWPKGKTAHMYKTTYYFLITQFARWWALELEQDPHCIVRPNWNHYQRLVTCAKQMDELGYLTDSTKEDQNCLTHPYLRGQNIMIDTGQDGSLELTGVLGWDIAMFVPVFVSCAPPLWLWVDASDTDVGEEDESKAEEMPKSTRNQRIKSAWEESVGENVMRYAYTPQYQLARKVFRLAISGVHSKWDKEKADAVLDEWDVMWQDHQELKSEIDAEQSEQFEDGKEQPEPRQGRAKQTHDESERTTAEEVESERSISRD